MEKTYWPSQWVFILAAIGSAAGLGNLWRFPYLAYENGGGAFVVAFIIANIIIGIPLLMLEIGLGQKTQKGAPDAFASIKKSFRYIGWTAVCMGFLVLSYYMAVVAYGINYFASSFTLAWMPSPNDYFFGEVLQISGGPAEIGGIAWPVMAGLLVGWVLVYFSAWKGVKSISAVVKWTATLPFLILFLLIVRALTLEGAGDGLRLFLVPEWSQLFSTDIWLAAFSQVFFSLSLAFGIMVAYGSLNRKNAEITKSIVWITIGNFMVSLMSGLVIFGTLGYMALQQGVGVTEVVAAGPGLVFIVFPEAISLLPALNAVVGILFFATFLMLAIDSAFSLLEALSTSIRDRFPATSIAKIAFVITVFGVGLGTLFATKAGLYYLDIADHFVVSYGLVAIGIAQAVVIGWFYQTKELSNYIKEHSKLHLQRLWLFSIRYFIPVFLTILFFINLRTDLTENYEGYETEALIYVGLVPLLLAVVAGFILDKLTTKGSG
jgi:NSS family neurotransmitter:Na+ symporter